MNATSGYLLPPGVKCTCLHHKFAYADSIAVSVAMLDILGVYSFRMLVLPGIAIETTSLANEMLLQRC